MKKSVRLYIEMKGLNDLNEEAVTTTAGDKSFKLTIDMDDTLYVLDIPKLSHKIDGAKWTQKSGDRIMVTLKKADTFTWYDLKATSS